jgi:hypothetical protein
VPIATAQECSCWRAAALLPGPADLLGTEPINMAVRALAVGPALLPGALVLLLRAVRRGR